MKKIIFSLSVVTACLFANDFGSSISKIDAKNPASFAESAFDINKKVGVAMKNSKNACEKFDNLLKNELSTKTKEEKEQFLKAYKKAYDDKIANLPIEEKAEFTKNACGKFHKFGKKIDKKGKFGEFDKKGKFDKFNQFDKNATKFRNKAK